MSHKANTNNNNAKDYDAIIVGAGLPACTSFIGCAKWAST